jgi:hypothetical protein
MGARRVGIGGLLFAGTWVIAGCGNGEDASATAVEALNPKEETFTAAVPALVSFRDIALGGTQHVSVGPGTLVLNEVVQAGPISNIGTQGTHVGSDAAVGSVFGRSGVTIGRDASVLGSIFSEEEPNVANSALVADGIVSDAELDPPTTWTWSVEFPSCDCLRTVVQKNQVVSLAPGRHGKVLVHSGGTLKLGPGTYYVESLQSLAADAKIEIEGAEPVFLYVSGALSLMGTFGTSDGQPTNVLVGAATSSSITLKGPFSGFVVAPEATLHLGGLLGETQEGAFFAHTILVEPNSRIVHRTFNRGIFFPEFEEPGSDDLPPISQASTPADGALTPNENYDPGHELCAPGLELVTIDEGNVTRSTEIHHATSDGTECVAEFIQCEEDNSGSHRPEESELNEVPDVSSTCDAIPPRFPCGIDESTIDWSDQGICDRDAVCVGRGMVCAVVCVEPQCDDLGCSDASCETFEQRCAQLSASCLGMPEESNCATIWECPEANAGFDSDPGAHTMAGQGESNTATADPPPATEPLPEPVPYMTDGDGCDGSHMPTLSVKPDAVPRDANSGNDKWGIFIHPEISHEATAGTLALGGEADVTTKIGATLTAGAYLWGHEAKLINVSGSAEISTCDAAVQRTVEILGFEVAPGGSDDPDPSPTPGCVTAVEDRGELAFDAKKALFDAVKVFDYAEAEGATAKLCESTSQFFDPSLGAYSNFPFTEDCSTEAGREAAVFHWFDWYKKQRDELADNQATINDAKQGLVDDLGSGELPIVDDERNFTAFDISFTYPVGPATVTVEIELVGTWGVSGSLVYGLARNPQTSIALGTAVTPKMGATVLVFAGVGFGPVSFGVGGELLIVELRTPLTTGVELHQVPSTDPRDKPFPDSDYAFADVPGAPAGFEPFGPTWYDWAAKWTYGSHAHLTMLAGELNLQARVNLLFFKKTYKKKLADWDGFTEDFTFMGGAGEDEPLSDSPAFGKVFENAYFVAPEWLSENVKLRQNATDAEAPAIALCFDKPK